MDYAKRVAAMRKELVKRLLFHIHIEEVLHFPFVSTIQEAVNSIY